VTTAGARSSASRGFLEVAKRAFVFLRLEHLAIGLDGLGADAEGGELGRRLDEAIAGLPVGRVGLGCPSMRHRAVFFDLGGTLFSYASINSHFDSVLESLAHEKRTLIFYESPHRSAATLSALAEMLPQRDAAMARELTKLHEELRKAGDKEALRNLRKQEWERVSGLCGN
jgi:hypothetical protein